MIFNLVRDIITLARELMGATNELGSGFCALIGSVWQQANIC